MIVQPLGNAGVLVVGTDTLRGLSRLDQVSPGLGGLMKAGGEGPGERDEGADVGVGGEHRYTQGAQQAGPVRRGEACESRDCREKWLGVGGGGGTHTQGGSGGGGNGAGKEWVSLGWVCLWLLAFVYW